MPTMAETAEKMNGPVTEYEVLPDCVRLVRSLVEYGPRPATPPAGIDRRGSGLPDLSSGRAARSRNRLRSDVALTCAPCLRPSSEERSHWQIRTNVPYRAVAAAGTPRVSWSAPRRAANGARSSVDATSAVVANALGPRGYRRRRRPRSDSRVGGRSGSDAQQVVLASSPAAGAPSTRGRPSRPLVQSIGGDLGNARTRNITTRHPRRLGKRVQPVLPGQAGQRERSAEGGGSTSEQSRLPARGLRDADRVDS